MKGQSIVVRIYVFALENKNCTSRNKKHKFLFKQADFGWLKKYNDYQKIPINTG